MCEDSDEYGKFLGIIGTITYQVAFSRFDTASIALIHSMFNVLYCEYWLLVFFEIRYRVCYQVGSSTNFRRLIFQVLVTGAYLVFWSGDTES